MSAVFEQECKFSGNCLNSDFHEVQIPALLLLIFSLFWRILAQVYARFQAFSFRSAYIPVQNNVALSKEPDYSDRDCGFESYLPKLTFKYS